MRYFNVRFTGEAVIALADEVIDAVDDEWRSMFYNLHTPEDIAEHIGYNLVVNHWDLTSLDGWADQPRTNAKLVYSDMSPCGAEELEEIDLL
jgi:hypothetical protein